jgi:hypothetical protein
VTGSLQGWQSDEFQRHEKRYYSNGVATLLVRDGAVESADPPGFGPSDPVTEVARSAPATAYSAPISPPPLYIEPAQPPLVYAEPIAPPPAYLAPVQPVPPPQSIYAASAQVPPAPPATALSVILDAAIAPVPAMAPDRVPAAAVSIEPGQTITIWVEANGPGSGSPQPIVVTATSAYSPAEPTADEPSAIAAPEPEPVELVQPAPEPEPQPAAPAPAPEPVAATNSIPVEAITVPVEVVGTYPRPAEPTVMPAVPEAIPADVAAQPDQLAAAALSIEPGQTVTIRVETIGTNSDSAAPIVVAATLSAPKLLAPDGPVAVIDQAASTADRPSLNSTEWTPPADSLRIHQPPFYPTSNYVSQLDFALQQHAAQLQSAYSQQDAYALPRLTPLPEAYEHPAAAPFSPPQDPPPPPPPTFQPPTPPAVLPPNGQPAAVQFPQPPMTAPPADQPPVVQSPTDKPVPPVARPPKRGRRRMWFGIVAAAVVTACLCAAVIVIAGSSGHQDAASASGTGPSSNGTVFTLKDAHFRARFPAPPTEIGILSQAVGPVQVSLRGAECTDPTTEVAMETATQAIAVDQQQNIMQLALSSFATPAGLIDDGEAPSTYSGHLARTANFSTSDGKQLTAMTFFYSDIRIYILAAKSGTPFTNLTASFSALP